MSNFLKPVTEVRKPVVLPILQWPDAMLSKASLPVLTDIVTDQGLQNFLEDMVETMKATRAVGLAAVQVGIPLRVLTVQDGMGGFAKVINPQLVEVSKEVAPEKEGCLSFIGVTVNVKRPKTVKVEYFNEKGEKVTTDSNGLLARAIQHEMDHLDGKTFLDRVSSVERSDILNKHRIMKRKVAGVMKKMNR